MSRRSAWPEREPPPVLLHTRTHAQLDHRWKSQRGEWGTIDGTGGQVTFSFSPSLSFFRGGRVGFGGEGADVIVRSLNSDHDNLHISGACMQTEALIPHMSSEMKDGITHMA